MAIVVSDSTWHHGRPDESVGFDPDRPAFFASDQEDCGFFAGDLGHQIEARLRIDNPIDEGALLKLAAEMGLEDVYAEDFDGFPGATTHLFDSRVRRRLEDLGYDGYVDIDGYILAAVVWDPSRIEIVGHRAWADREPAPAAMAP